MRVMHWCVWSLWSFAALATAAAQQDIPSDLELIAAYQSVFTVHGGATVASVGPPVQYVEDRLRVLLGVPPTGPFDLAYVRGMDRQTLLTLLFKSVAGDYTAGPNALRPDVCRLVSDPATGVIEVTRNGEDDEPVLIVISVVLLCVLVIMMYRRDAAR